MSFAPLIQAVSKNDESKRFDLEVDGFIDQKSGMIFQKNESKIKVEASVELISFFISRGLAIDFVLFGPMNGSKSVFSGFGLNSDF